MTTFLPGCRWTQNLSPAELQRVTSEMIERKVSAGGYMCRKGEPVESLIGVIDGLVKMCNLSAEGKLTTLTGVPPGGWFGEGSLLKDQSRKTDILALRDSRIAYLPHASRDRCRSYLIRSSIRVSAGSYRYRRKKSGSCRMFPGSASTRHCRCWKRPACCGSSMAA